jgi:hypothetical protein
MTKQITAPWTIAQVNALNRFQQEANMHPFTCGALHGSGQSPVLEATQSGWVCPDPTCEYTQDWAHAFMADPDAWPKFPFGERHGPTPEEVRTAATRAPAAADALAAEWHRRHQRLEDLTKSKGPEAQVAIVEHVRGELVGLRGALGILLGGEVKGGTADLLGWSYYQEWRKRQEGQA